MFDVVSSKKSLTHKALIVGVLIKGIHSAIEVIGAVALFFVSGTTLINIVSSIASRELIEDPRDILAQFLLNQAGLITKAGQDFAILYLLISALVNGILIFAIVSHRRAAYIFALVLLIILTLYESYIFAHTFSIWLGSIIVYDIVLIVLMIREYRTVVTTNPDSFLEAH